MSRLQEADSCRGSCFLPEDDGVESQMLCSPTICEEEPACRICFEPGGPEMMVSPCLCSGSQQFVHLSCLRKWQAAVQDQRATHCQVCKVRYAFQPPGSASSRLVSFLKSSATFACVALLVAGLTGPPWPHFALVAVMLLGTRTSSLPGAIAMSGILSLLTLYSRGIRIAVRSSVEAGAGLGLSLIRTGSPIQGLSSGSFLVASASLDHSLFQRTVVLLLEHAGRGAKGVILNRPIDALALGLAPSGMSASAGVFDTTTNPSSLAGAPLAQPQSYSGLLLSDMIAEAASEDTSDTERAPSSPPAPLEVRSFLGGPVGLGQERVILHSCSGLRGSRLVAPGTEASAPVYEGGDGVEDLLPAWGVGQGDGVEARQGGIPDPVVAFMNALASDSLAGLLAVPEHLGAWLLTAVRQASQAAAAAGVPGAVPMSNPPAASSSSASSSSSPTPTIDRIAYLREARATCVRPVAHVFHGVASWAPSQLEGEIRAGAWGFGPARAPDIRLGELPKAGAAGAGGSLRELPGLELWEQVAARAEFLTAAAAAAVDAHVGA